MKNNPHSKYVFFEDDDIESHVMMNIFKNTSMDYNPMNGMPSNLNYLHLKDNIKWNGLKPSKYTNLLMAMSRNFVNHLPRSG